MKNNQRKLLLDFTKYCLEHPQERFWQALSNWSNSNFILTAKYWTNQNNKDEYTEIIDTYYWENKDN